MKKIVKAEVNSFVKGFISEASPLNFPDKATIDELNFDLNIDGTRDRRLGFDIEPGGVLTGTNGILSANRETGSFSTFVWNTGGVSGISKIIVIQVNDRLRMYNGDIDNPSTGFLAEVSPTYLLGTVPKCSFSVIENKLIVAYNSTDLIIVTYEGGTTFSLRSGKPLVRDVWGHQETINPGYENVTFRSASISPQHQYNLNNQSWAVSRKNSAGTLIRPVTQYFTDLALYPSNSEVVWTGLQFQPVTAGVTFERIYTNLYTELLESRLVAPKGYYIVDPTNLGYSRLIAYCATEGIVGAGIGAIKTEFNASWPDSSTGASRWGEGGISVISSFAGRLWYGGWKGKTISPDIRHPDLRNMICFSQVVKSVDDIFKCYQEGDPTSRDGSDLVETDGGFIKIPDLGETLGMINLGPSLVIITTNGVWSVSGGAEYGFTATNYKVSKISAFGCVSASSIVVENNNIYYWGDTGINILSRNQVGDLEVSNITQASIQTFFSSIPKTSKEESFGVYDRFSKKIKWMYKENGRFNSNSKTWELVLDLNLQAYTKNLIEPFQSNLVYSVVGAVQGNLRKLGGRNDDGCKYVIAYDNGTSLRTTFGEYGDLYFVDWRNITGTSGNDAKAYLLAGQQTAGDSSVDKQIPYLTMHFRRTEVGVDSVLLTPLKPSSCKMRCRWDFSNTINSNKWSPIQQVYRYPRAQYVVNSSDQYDSGYEVITTKNKIRGSGKAFSLYLETEPLFDCRVLGWNIALSGNTNV